MFRPGGLGMADEASDAGHLMLHLLLDLVDGRVNGGDIRVRRPEAMEMHHEACRRLANAHVVDRADLAGLRRGAREALGDARRDGSIGRRAG
jgi:hypothetical protein